MANDEAERENLMRRPVPVGNWNGNAGSNSVPVPIPLPNRALPPFQPPILGQPAMQQTQQTGNALQQWRLNQQTQQFSQTIPGALPNSPMAYQTRPSGAPYVDSADAAAAVAAARSRMSQAQRADPALYGGSNPNTASATSPASNAAAAAVLARVYQQQGIPNPHLPNSQPLLMQKPTLPDDPWKTITGRPQLPQALHLPSMPLHPANVQPVRPPTTILGPQMPTPFPGPAPPPLMRPSFGGSPPPPSRPTFITDQPRLVALMAEYSNRLASGSRLPPPDFPHPMMPPRPTPPVAQPSPRPALAVYPVTGVPGNPIRPGSSIPSTLTSNMYHGSRPVIPGLGIPVSLPGSLPNAAAAVPNNLVNLQTKPQLGLAWQDPRIPAVHPGPVPLVRSSSAPPIPPLPYFNPLIHFSHVPMTDLSAMGIPLTYPMPDPMFAPKGCAPDERPSSESETYAPKAESKEEASGEEPREEEMKQQQQQQRAVSRDSVVCARVSASASHGDTERDGLAHRRHQTGSSNSRSAWIKTVRSRPPDEVSDDDLVTHRKFLLSDTVFADTPTGGATSHQLSDLLLKSESNESVFVETALVEHELIKPVIVEHSFDQEYVEQEVTDNVVAKPTESRNVVISEFNRHAALVEDTVETMSDNGPSLASNKHRKVATQRNPRRRAVLRPTLSNTALASKAFGEISNVVVSYQRCVLGAGQGRRYIRIVKTQLTSNIAGASPHCESDKRGF